MVVREQVEAKKSKSPTRVANLFELGSLANSDGINELRDRLTMRFPLLRRPVRREEAKPPVEPKPAEKPVEVELKPHEKPALF